MNIYVSGDPHGEQGRIYEVDKMLKEDDMIIFAGDFAYLFKNDFHENRFLDDLEARPYTILFVDGNHENFPAIYSYPEEMWNGGKIHRIRKNIIHMCRGQVFEIAADNDTIKLFTFGGGYSLDKATRTEGKTWWPEELPTMKEYDEGKKNLEKHNWEVDYIITHTLNYKSIQVLAAMDRYNEIKPLCSDEGPLNFYLEDIREQAKYKEWFFGHFHRDKKIDYTRQRALWFDVVKLGD